MCIEGCSIQPLLRSLLYYSEISTRNIYPDPDILWNFAQRFFFHFFFFIFFLLYTISIASLISKSSLSFFSSSLFTFLSFCIRLSLTLNQFPCRAFEPRIDLGNSQRAMCLHPRLPTLLLLVHE